MSQPIKKLKDIKLFLVLIPCINLVNYYLTYEHITLSWYTFLTFSLDTIEGILAWLLCRYIIFYCDKKLPFENGPLKRIIVQLTTTLLFGLSIIILLTEGINFIATDKPVPEEFYTTDLVIISIWFFVLNGIYLGLYLYEEWQQSKAAIRKEELLFEEARRLKVKGFLVKSGKSELILSYGEIAGFSTEGEYILCSTVGEKKYLLDQSIDKIEKELPPTLFFRLNRQVLVHRQMVLGFQRIENGKLNVLITAHKHISSPVTVSRIKAAAFKTWFLPEPEFIPG